LKVEAVLVFENGICGTGIPGQKGGSRVATFSVTGVYGNIVLPRTRLPLRSVFMVTLLLLTSYR
jgi:hypothetical protein